MSMSPKGKTSSVSGSPKTFKGKGSVDSSPKESEDSGSTNTSKQMGMYKNKYEVLLKKFQYQKNQLVIVLIK